MMKNNEYEKRYIDNFIRKKLIEESVKAEILVLSIFRIVIPLFMVTPVLYIIVDVMNKKSVNIFYIILFMYMFIIFLYHSYIISYLKKSLKYYNLIRFINITIEIATISTVILLIKNVFNAEIILSGPLVMVYQLMIMMSCFRFSFRLSIFAGIMAAFQHFILYLIFIREVPQDIMTRLIDLGLSGILQKTIYILFTGIISAIIAMFSKSMLLAIANKQYETNQLKNTFGLYVSKEIRDIILNNEKILNNNDTYGAILFVNISNFNELLLNGDSKTLLTQLNELFDELILIINKNNGVVNKIIGETMMVVFGLIGNSKYSDFLSLLTASQIIEKIDELNKKWDNEKKYQLKLVCGISSGYFVTGNVGSEERKEFTCMGDVVNIASRLQNLAKIYNKNIIVSESIKNNISENYHKALNFISEEKLKGKNQLIKTFEVDNKEIIKIFNES